MSLQTLDLSKFQLLNQIGHGSFGAVYRVKDTDTNTIYAAKVSNQQIDENNKDSQEVLFLFREINIMSALNHPSIIQFIGFSKNDFKNTSKPTIILEYASKGTLRDVIKDTSSGYAPENWNDTMKLICIYGIASGIAFLHKHKILHRDLKPENILMDDHLLPKISDFGLSKFNSSISESLNAQSKTGTKGTIMYIAPEIFEEELYSEKTDVYAFSIIVYEIMTLKEPFEHTMPAIIMKKVVNGERPEILSDVPESYRLLIQKCWDQDPNKRPTFDEILDILKSDDGFITDLVEKMKFIDYCDYFDNYDSSFDIEKNRVKLNDFLRTKNEKVNEIEEKSTKNHENDDEQGNQNNQNCSPSLYPLHEFDKLSTSCQSLVNEASSNPSKQFIVGKNLVEGLDGFPQNVQLGIKFLQLSRLHKYNSSLIYLSGMYINGDVVPTDFEEARKILDEVDDKNDASRMFLLGLIELNEENKQDAFQLFQKASKFGKAEAMFYCGKMLMDGDGIGKNEKEGTKYLELAKKNGCNETYEPKELNKKKRKQSQKKKDKEMNKIENHIPEIMHINVKFVGCTCSGKSVALSHISKGQIEYQYVGTPFQFFDSVEDYKGRKFDFHYCELCGLEDFCKIRPLYYPDADVFVLFMSVINLESIDKLSNYFIPEIEQCIKGKPYILVVSGMDFLNDEAYLKRIGFYGKSPISKKQIDVFAKNYGIKRVIYMSITTKENIDDIPKAIIETYIENLNMKGNDKSCSIF